MKSGLCPKCSSRRVLQHNYDKIYQDRPEYPGDYFTCADCAYTEWYPEDIVADLVAIADGRKQPVKKSVQGMELVIKIARWINPDQSPYR